MITTNEWLKTRWNFDWAWLARGINPATVCEVGIGPKDISMLPWFEPGRNCGRLIGIDPNPEFCRWARELPGSEIHECAIGDKAGKETLVLNGGSSFLEGKWSPTPVCPSESMVVDVEPFHLIDPGDIDVLNADCEGGEKAVLARMVSRPKIIGLELWDGNPDRGWILDWLHLRDYTLKATSGPEGETMIWGRDS